MNPNAAFWRRCRASGLIGAGHRLAHWCYLLSPAPWASRPGGLPVPVALPFGGTGFPLQVEHIMAFPVSEEEKKAFAQTYGSRPRPLAPIWASWAVPSPENRLAEPNVERGEGRPFWMALREWAVGGKPTVEKFMDVLDVVQGLAEPTAGVAKALPLLAGITRPQAVKELGKTFLDQFRDLVQRKKLQENILRKGGRKLFALDDKDIPSLPFVKERIAEGAEAVLSTPKGFLRKIEGISEINALEELAGTRGQFFNTDNTIGLSLKNAVFPSTLYHEGAHGLTLIPQGTTDRAIGQIQRKRAFNLIEKWGKDPAVEKAISSFFQQKGVSAPGENSFYWQISPLENHARAFAQLLPLVKPKNYAEVLDFSDRLATEELDKFVQWIQKEQPGRQVRTPKEFYKPRFWENTSSP